MCMRFYMAVEAAGRFPQGLIGLYRVVYGSMGVVDRGRWGSGWFRALGG